MKILSDNDKKRLGNVVIKRIRDRTQSGTGVQPSGREYSLDSKPYSEKYARQKGSSKVDLTNSGDMLENMFVKEVGRDTVDISVRSRDIGKLRGAEEGILRNRVNSEGKKLNSKQLVKRPFFHLSKRDKEEIANDPETERIFQRAFRREQAKKRRG